MEAPALFAQEATQWERRSLEAVWHPCTQMQRHLPAGDPNALPLLPVARAAGPWLYGFDGRAYYDAISSWWTTLFGHRHPPIIAAIKEQLDTLDHVLLAGCTHAAAVELAERLRALTGGQLGHAFFASDGASATEIALKMAAHYARNRGFPCKTGFVCFAGGYHGETIGALGVTDVPLFRQAYEPLLRPATILPCPDARLGPPALERAVCALRSHLQAHAEEVAAVIVEPMVQCAGGMIMHSPEFLRCVRRLCDEYGVLLIFDEIAVGCGRTGRLFAHEHAGVRPDLLCLSKGITGGTLPLAVVLTTDEVFEAFLDERIERGFLHSHSYTGNPLACRAACATLALLEEPGIPERLEALGAAFERALAPIAAQHGAAHLRRCGTLVAFDLPKAAEDFPRRAAVAALEYGLLLRPLGRTVYVMPPYETRPEEVDFACEAIARTLADVL